MPFAARIYNLIDDTEIKQNFTATGVFSGANFGIQTETESFPFSQTNFMSGKIVLRFTMVSGQAISDIDCVITGNIFTATISGVTNSSVANITPIYIGTTEQAGTTVNRIKITPPAAPNQTTISINNNLSIAKRGNLKEFSAHNVNLSPSGRHQNINTHYTAKSIVRTLNEDTIYSGEFECHPDDVGFDLIFLQNNTWELKDGHKHEFRTETDTILIIIILKYHKGTSKKTIVYSSQPIKL